MFEGSEHVRDFGMFWDQGLSLGGCLPPSRLRFFGRGLAWMRDFPLRKSTAFSCMEARPFLARIRGLYEKGRLLLTLSRGRSFLFRLFYTLLSFCSPDRQICLADRAARTRAKGMKPQAALTAPPI